LQLSLSLLPTNKMDLRKDVLAILVGGSPVRSSTVYPPFWASIEYLLLLCSSGSWRQLCDFFHDHRSHQQWPPVRFSRCSFDSFIHFLTVDPIVQRHWYLRRLQTIEGW
jgi:hypothetical protein